MAKEIERKYLVKNDSYKSMANTSYSIKQGYLSMRKDATVRVRTKNDKAYITIKGVSTGCSRNEWEYTIPFEDAVEMLAIADGEIIEKTRYIVDYQGYKWEIDVFHGKNDGLIFAEIELGAENETFPLPPFIGQEVTGDPAYYNSVIAQKKTKCFA